MSNTAISKEQGPPERRKSASTPPSRQAKAQVLLVTQDDSLWPQVGGSLSVSLHLKQVDGVDELLATVPASQSAIVLWDARGVEAPAAALSKLQLHSSHFAVVVLDDAAAGATWQPMTVRGQIVAFVPMPLDAQRLNQAIDAAGTEVGVRGALLGEASVAVPVAKPKDDKTKLIVAGIALVVLVGAAVAYFASRGSGPAPTATAAKSVVAPAPTHTEANSVAATNAPAVAVPEAPVGGSASAGDDRVYELLASAQQAMRDRHYIDPAAGSALKYYHDALLFDPGNEEAHQGMQRLAEVLFSRVQSALDERKFDIALQSLETARSISPADPRLAAIDARVASMRAELGTGQIQAAINAQAYDRAEQLLDEAVRAKTLTDAKAAQLRDDLNRRRKDSDLDGLEKLIDARLQQDHLVEPHNDNASYYLEEARRAGASAAVLAPRAQELARRLHLHEVAASASTAAAHAKAEQPAFPDLIETRLSQGKVVDPDGDSALYYLNQLSVTDPTNSRLAKLSSEVQLQIIARATAALDASETDSAKTLVRLAAALGASPELASVTDRLNRQVRARDVAEPIPSVDVQTLVPIHPLRPEYPSDALQAGTEGWVDLTFTVTAEGKVTNVVVVDASPANTFERAAREAMSRTKYKPVVQNGHAIAVTSKLRVGFKLAGR